MTARTADTLIDIMLSRAAEHPDDIAYRFHRFGAGETQDVVMDALARSARAIAETLSRRGLAGERVILALPHGPDFIRAFYGCLAAGAVAVPVPMLKPGKEDRRFEAVLKDARPALVLVDQAAVDQARSVVDKVTQDGGARADVATVDQIEGDPTAWKRPHLGADTLAILQYTSGSTGDPKGVMITHGNFVANARLIQSALRVTASSTGVLWLPFYHDMGLVGGVVMPMYAGATVDLMSPQDFLRAPIRWLEALAERKATITAAPNFALELCCDLASAETLEGLDLSHLGCLLTGSEPVNANTVERFMATFGPYGFRRDAVLPAYGLAEATLLATGTLRDRVGPTIRAFDGKALEGGRPTAAQGNAPARRLVGNGAPETRVRIAEPETGRPLGDGEIGEIWLTGESIAKGYFGRPELSSHAFGARLLGEPDSGPFYRTGDLGFVEGDDLFVTGRIKDLVILRGRNIHPQDVEESATRNEPRLWTGGSAAFGVDRGAGEELILIVEAGRSSVSALKDETSGAALAADLVARIVEAHEVMPAEIAIVRPGRIPRTTSGKIRRSAAREEWQASGFAAGLIHRWTRPEGDGASAFAGPVIGECLTRQDVEAWLIARLAHHCGRPPHQIALDEPFASYGLDSRMAIEMISAINGLNIGKSVEPTDLYDHPTIERLLDHMFAQTAESDRPAETVADKDAPRDLEQEAAALRALLDA